MLQSILFAACPGLSLLPYAVFPPSGTNSRGKRCPTTRPGTQAEPLLSGGAQRLPLARIHSGISDRPCLAGSPLQLHSHGISESVARLPLTLIFSPPGGPTARKAELAVQGERLQLQLVCRARSWTHIRGKRLNELGVLRQATTQLLSYLK